MKEHILEIWIIKYQGMWSADFDEVEVLLADSEEAVKQKAIDDLNEASEEHNEKPLDWDRFTRHFIYEIWSVDHKFQ